ncbi:MAG: YihY/virulence factor BrkB family protein [Candidatus Dormibacteraeota bacterium]|nr:YihY/virulence factor BrkB family protein [Candidatus Dormibacteraeota bacterium]MBV9525432.1 YihY/virulence factor BrkB family protein [Candidatus Dormibacteraeota bacterium]
MSALKSVIGGFLNSYPGRLIQAYAGSQAGNYASGLAFTAFISMFPLILGGLAVLGLATQSRDAEQHFLSAVLSFFPGDASKPLTAALDGVRHHSGLLGALGLVGLFWSGSSLFVAMEFALGRMLGARQRDFLRQRAMTALMTIVFVVAVVATIVVNSALSLLHGIAEVGPIIGLLVWYAFMAAVYRLVPNHTHRLREMWPGVLIAGTLMEVLTLLWPLYTGLSHGFSTYGVALALFFVLAAWLYFLAQFILLGAVANRMHAGRPSAHGLIASPEPSPLETEATRAADQQARRRRAA